MRKIKKAEAVGSLMIRNEKCRATICGLAFFKNEYLERLKK